MPTLEMRKQDLIELYQLLKMYMDTYEPADTVTIQQVMSILTEKYEKRTDGERLERARNPRGAGRPGKYSLHTDTLIYRLRNEGRSIREIAREIKCSPGYVQKLLSKKGTVS